MMAVQNVNSTEKHVFHNQEEKPAFLRTEHKKGWQAVYLPTKTKKRGSAGRHDVETADPIFAHL
jgi:hypothetical protein